MVQRTHALIGLGLLLAASSCGRVGFSALDEQPADASIDIARCFSEPGGSSSLTLDAFALEFATPNTLRFRWESTDPVGEFSEYEVLLMPADASECDVQRVDQRTNPGLGHFRGPDVDHLLVATSIGSLAPNTRYVAQLLIHDESGASRASELRTVQTSRQPQREFVLFSEGAATGYSIPDTLTIATGDAFSGSEYLEFVSDCLGGCFENLRRQDIGISLSTMTPEDFSQAYYEFAIASSGTEHSYWSQVRLSFDQEDGSRELFIYAPMVLAARETYTVHQIPLRAFSKDAQATQLNYDFASRGVYEFTVGGNWPLGDTVRLDELRILW